MIYRLWRYDVADADDVLLMQNDIFATRILWWHAYACDLNSVYISVPGRNVGVVSEVDLVVGVD